MASDRITVSELLVEGRRRLAAVADLDLPPREAALLLAHALSWREARLYARDEEAVPAPVAERFRELIDRRCAGEPVAYLTGEREFWGHRFAVDDRVLIPRPETEHLIEAALSLDLPDDAKILDVGTGSGAIAVSLALEKPGARVVAVDLSPAALAVARTNARQHGVGERVRFVCCDVASALAVLDFDLVVSNPPYIAEDEMPTLSREITDHEPHSALTADDGGLSIIARIAQSLGALPTGTPLLLEIGHRHDRAIGDVLAPHFRLERLLPDYAGVRRLAVARRSDPTDPAASRVLDA